MNNTQKLDYLDCLATLDNKALSQERKHIKDTLEKAPDHLFKYTRINKFTFLNISNNSLRLSPVEKLDDPFDCVSNFSIESFYNTLNKIPNDKFIDHFVNKIKKQFKFSFDIKATIKSCMGDCGLDKSKMMPVLLTIGHMNKEKANKLCDKFINLQNLVVDSKSSKSMESAIKIMKDPGKNLGVGSLSNVKDNKVMWALYGKEYEGCCIEYDIPKDIQATRYLFPVLYSKRISNNFAINLFDTFWSIVTRNTESSLFDNKIKGMGSIMVSLCLKDTDWSFQQEWRVIGKPNTDFQLFNIKAVFLGFKVCKTNETKMKRLAKKNHFSLYKMDPPSGDKKIRYTQIV